MIERATAWVVLASTLVVLALSLALFSYAVVLGEAAMQMGDTPPGLLGAASRSLVEAVVAVGIGGGIGFGAAFWLEDRSLPRWPVALVKGVVDVGRAAPPAGIAVALVPLAVGLGPPALAVLPVVVMGLVAGAHVAAGALEVLATAPRDARLAARALGAQPHQIVAQVVLPRVAPQLIAVLLDAAAVIVGLAAPVAIVRALVPDVALGLAGWSWVWAARGELGAFVGLGLLLLTLAGLKLAAATLRERSGVEP